MEMREFPERFCLTTAHAKIICRLVRTRHIGGSRFAATSERRSRPYPPRAALTILGSALLTLPSEQSRGLLSTSAKPGNGLAQTFSRSCSHGAPAQKIPPSGEGPSSTSLRSTNRRAVPALYRRADVLALPLVLAGCLRTGPSPLRGCHRGHGLGTSSRAARRPVGGIG
jgi:hypothetical protein